MLLTKKSIGVLLFLALSAAAARAQTKLPAETRNAALRYWMASSQLQDTGADKSTADLIEKTLAGEVPWNEAQLGHLIDDNTEALEIMQRATKLPECDWGLEYSLGPRTPIPFIKNSARALARLNTLYGMRLAAKGDTQKAVDAWLAGVQFTRHLAQGQSLLGTLVAGRALSANLHVLTQSAQRGAFSAAQKNQVSALVRSLPDAGFDWGQAMWYEELPIQITIQDMEKAPSVAAYYQEVIGTPAPANFTIPSDSDVAAFHKLMAAVEAALRLPPRQAQEKLMTLQDSIKTLHPFFQAVIPNLSRINDVRIKIQSSRQELLQALAAN
jgi:hypothetical protein